MLPKPAPQVHPSFSGALQQVEIDSPLRHGRTWSGRPASLTIISCERSAGLTVIPGRAKREPGIHNHDREYGFRACAKRHIHDVQLHIGE